MKSRISFASAARASTLLAAAFVAAGAFAGEATQFELPQPMKTRQQVIAELAQAQQANRLLSRGEASTFELPQQSRTRSRQEVSAEAAMASRSTVGRDQFSGG